MSKNKTLHDFEEIIRACVKCGVCQAHCPTYQANKDEGSVARGKIALAAAIIDGETELEDRLKEDMSMCLMCGSCVSKCPSKVPTHEIVGAIRRQVTDDEGLSFIGKSISTLLGSKPLMKTLTKSGAAVSSLFLKKVPDTSGLRLRFPVSLMKDRTLPKVAFKNLFDRVPEFVEGVDSKPVVGFFAGCSITYVYPEIGEWMVSILKDMGYSVYTPRAQKCCGIPALSSGNGKLIEGLSANNVDAFRGKKVEHIITACGSCNSGIGEYYSSMDGSDDDFTDKVIDFSVFLKEMGLFEKLAEMEKQQNAITVAYHDPCHLKVQGITKEPRELLRLLPNVNYVEAEGASYCCGLGGTFSVYHYDTSKKIGGRKMEGLEDSGAELIATACPGCMMQLQDSINHADLKIKAVHILELLAKALKLEERKVK